MLAQDKGLPTTKSYDPLITRLREDTWQIKNVIITLSYGHQTWEKLNFDEGVLPTKSHAPFSYEFTHNFAKPQDCKIRSHVKRLHGKQKMIQFNLYKAVATDCDRLVTCSAKLLFKGSILSSVFVKSREKWRPKYVHFHERFSHQTGKIEVEN